MADQELSLGTLFTGRVDQSFNRAIDRLRSVLQGLASEQTRAERVSRATVRRFQSDTEGAMTNVQRLMGQFTGESNVFQAQMRRALENITSPIQQNKIAAQFKNLEGNIGLVARQMNEVASGSGRFLSQKLREGGIEAKLFGQNIEFLRGRFVANDEAGRQWLQHMGLQDNVSKKYTQSLQAQQKAQGSVIAQNERWLNQFKSNPAILAKAKQALVSVEKAAGQVGAQMIAAGKGGAYWYSSLPKAAIATKVLQGDVQILGNKFASANFEGKKFLENLQLGGHYTPQFAAKLRELGGTSDFVGKQIGRVRGGIERLAAAFKVTASYAVAGGVIMALRSTLLGTKEAIYEYNQALANLAAITNATTPDLKAMGEAIKSVASDTKFSTKEVADAMIVLGQAGLSAGESVDAIRAVATLATGTLEDMEKTADLLTTTLRSFDMAASESGRVADVMANAINRSKLTVEKFRTAFNYIAPVAHLAGLSLEDTAAAMEILANAGLRGSTIGTSFRQTLQRLIAPTADLRDAFAAAGADMNKLNPRTSDLATIFDELGRVVPTATRAFSLFGLRAAPAVAAFVTAGREGFETFLNELYDVGAAEDMMQKQMKGLQAQAGQLASKVKILAIELGEGGLATAFDLAYEAARPLIDGLTAFAKNEVGRVIIAFSGLAAAIFGLYEALRFLRVVLLAALVPNKTISDIKKLRATGESVGGVFENLWKRIVQLGKLARAHPILSLITAFAGLAYATKSWIDSSKRAYEQLQQEGITLDKQIKSLAGYKTKIEEVKNSHVALHGTVRRLIKEFPDLADELEEAGDNIEKINAAIEKYKAIKVWESIQNNIDQMEKLNRVTKNQIAAEVLWRRIVYAPNIWAVELWKEAGQIGEALKKIVTEIDTVFTEDIPAVVKATPVGGIMDAIFGKGWYDALKKEATQAVDDTKTDFAIAFGPGAKKIVDIAESAFSPFTQEISAGVRKNAKDVTAQLQDMSQKLQLVGITSESSIEEIAEAMRNELPKSLEYSQAQLIEFARAVKSKWEALKVVLKTYSPLDYDQMGTEVKMRKQKELIEEMGADWLAYYKIPERVKVPAQLQDGWMSRFLAKDSQAFYDYKLKLGDFADYSRVKLAEYAIEAKKEIEKREKEMKEASATDEQIQAEARLIRLKWLEKYIEDMDKFRDEFTKKSLEMQRMYPAVTQRAPFEQWVRELYDMDVEKLSDEFREKLRIIYDKGLKMVLMRDLPKATQERVQQLNLLMGKQMIGPDEWVLPTMFEEFSKTTVSRIKKGTDEIEAAFEAASKRFGVSLELIRAIAWKESKFNQEARGGKGEVGIMQILPTTAKDYKGNIYEAAENIMVGTEHFKKCMMWAEGDLELALKYYNAGKKGWETKKPPSAQTYADDVLALIGELSPARVNKLLFPFLDAGALLGQAADKMSKVVFPPKIKNLDELLGGLISSNKELGWVVEHEIVKVLGEYGKTWDVFLKKEIDKINRAHNSFDAAVKELYEIGKAQGKFTPEMTGDWEQIKDKVIEALDPLVVFRQILLSLGVDSNTVSLELLANLEAIRDKFKPVVDKMAEYAKTSERLGTLSDRPPLEEDYLQGKSPFYDVEFEGKKAADSAQYYWDNIRGEFIRGERSAESWADAVKQAYRAGAISYQEYLSQTKAATENAWENFKFGLKIATNNIMTYGQMWQKIGTEIIDVIAEGMTDALMDFIDGTKTAKEAFIDFAKSILQWLAKILMQTALKNMLGGVTGLLFHEGGVVGMDRSGRKAIRKFHQGYAGVAADEVPAILKKNEVVFTPGQMKALGAMIQGGNTTSITVPIQVSGDINGRLSSRLRSNVEDAVRRTLREEMK